MDFQERRGDLVAGSLRAASHLLGEGCSVRACPEGRVQGPRHWGDYGRVFRTHLEKFGMRAGERAPGAHLGALSWNTGTCLGSLRHPEMHL